MARAGDRAAQGFVLESLQPVLRSFFGRRVGTPDDIDDLVQNALIRILRGIGDLKDVRSLRAFAMKAALFELQDHYRGRHGMRESLLDPDGAEPRGQTAPEGLSMDLDKALALLPDKARAILELKAMGYRYDEIATHLGTTEAAVKMQVKRSLERLRSFLSIPVGLLILLIPGLR